MRQSQWCYKIPWNFK